jgi:hypothetical protein
MTYIFFNEEKKIACVEIKRPNGGLMFASRPKNGYFILQFYWFGIIDGWAVLHTLACSNVSYHYIFSIRHSDWLKHAKGSE